MTYPRLSTLFVLLCLTLVAGLMFLASPALAAGPIVTTAADESDGCAVGDCSLREAIATAASGETITFADSYTITLGSPLVISTSLTIAGGNHAITVSGNHAVRVFRVTNNALVTLDTLTVTHGYGGTDFNCSVIAECGGGIKVEAGAVLTLTHSAVISNTASRGGGIYNNGMLLIAHSTISGNVGTMGGGIDSWNVLTVQHSLVANNSADNGGGGIYDEHPYHGGSLTVEDSRIVDNSGGGIQAESTSGYDDPVIVRNSVIANNSGGFGGGIQVGTLLTITNTTISGNTAVAGGGIQIRGIDPVFITNSTISGNRASQNGGGIGNDINRPHIYLTHSTIVSNTAEGQGGGLYAFQRAAFTLTHTILADNLDTGGQTPDCAIVAPTLGGGIYSTGYNLIGDTTGCGLLTHTTDLLNQNAWLEPLADNGGDTQTHALGIASPAIDLIPAASCPLTTDQRGKPRPLGDACDSGAYETRAYRQRLPLVFKNGTPAQ